MDPVLARRQLNVERAVDPNLNCRLVRGEDAGIDAINFGRHQGDVTPDWATVLARHLPFNRDGLGQAGEAIEDHTLASFQEQPQDRTVEENCRRDVACPRAEPQ